MKKMNIGLIVGLIIGALGIGVGIYASINPKAVNDFMDSPNVEAYFPLVIIALVVLPMIFGFGPTAMSAIKNSQKKKRLLQVGQKTTGTILDIQDTGVTVNMAPYVKITVQTKNGVKAEFQTLISRVQIPRVGDVIELLYDPADPTIVMPA